MSRMILFGLALAAFGLFASFPTNAQARLDPKSKTPYQLNIVLHFSRHQVFTSAFKKRVEKRLLSLLGATYGKLARVQIQTHPLLNEVLQKGLQSALDNHDKLSTAKTHFVLIDYEDGSYRIRTRQEDGATGLSPGPSREAMTRDRFQVPRLAAKLVDHDFGLTATLLQVNPDPARSGGTARVAIQGGQLGVSLDRWLKPGDVFAVCRILQQAGETQSDQLDWTLLRVVQILDDGICQCEYYQRFRGLGLQPGPGVLGYRCLRLTTIRDHLRLQFVPFRGQRITGGTLKVSIGRNGFNDKVVEEAVESTLRVHITQQFNGIAFVKVRSKTETLAEFVVPIVDSEFVSCPISVNLKGKRTAFIRFRYARWLRRIYEGLNVSADRASRLNGELKKSPEAALLLARTGERVMTGELKRLREQRDELKTLALKVKPPLDIDKGSRFLSQLEARHASLQKFIESLEALINEMPETRRLQALVKRAQLFTKQGEYDEALKLYDQVLVKRPGLMEVAKRRKALKAQWQLPGFDDPESKLYTARRFLTNVWSGKLDTKGLQENIPKVREAFGVCLARNDWLALRKLLLANSRHAAFVSNRVEVLNRSSPTEDIRTELVTLEKLTKDLDQLHQDVSKSIRGKT
ncbi:MAG: tol-pal system YbgF family protein [Gemmataceae bacterium]